MEKPILFNTEMSLAVRSGVKTQTRRLVDPQPKSKYPIGTITCSSLKKREGCFGWSDDKDALSGISDVAKPPYQVGDILWVKESCYMYGHWVTYYNGDPEAENKKDRYSFVWDRSKPVMYMDNKPDAICKSREEKGYFLRPSIFMPRVAARTFLEVTRRRVERAGEISEKDAIAEGCKICPSGGFVFPGTGYDKAGLCHSTAATAFFIMFQELYSDSNDDTWVWAYDFKLLKAN